MALDTPPEIEQMLIEGYRKMPAWKRLQQVVDLNKLVQQMAMDDIRRRHPQAQ